MAPSRDCRSPHRTPGSVTLATLSLDLRPRGRPEWTSCPERRAVEGQVRDWLRGAYPTCHVTLPHISRFSTSQPRSSSSRNGARTRNSSSTRQSISPARPLGRLVVSPILSRRQDAEVRVASAAAWGSTSGHLHLSSWQYPSSLSRGEESALRPIAASRSPGASLGRTFCASIVARSTTVTPFLNVHK